MSSRALRRHHRVRMIERAKFVVRRWFGWTDRLSEDELHRRAAKVADNLAVCSCRACCNPRHADRWQGPTLTRQEQRADDPKRICLRW